jgi:betaine reductase
LLTKRACTFSLPKAEADPQAWEEQVSMMEMVVDGETLTKAVADMRQANGLSVL